MPTFKKKRFNLEIKRQIDDDFLLSGVRHMRFTLQHIRLS